MKMVNFKEDMISSFSLGCLNFGTKTDEKTSFEILDKFFEEGGNFLDTSNNYAFWCEGAKGGESESVLGKWFQERKKREKIFLATKGGAMPNDLKSGFDDVEGLSKEAIIKAVDNSLLRLKTDYIDLYYAHIHDDKVSQEETLETLNDLIKAGKIRNIGCSNYTLKDFQETEKVSREKSLENFSCIQNRYTYLSPKKDADFGVQRYFDNEYLDYMRSKDIKLLGYSPLLGGYYNKGTGLSSKYSTESVKYKMDVIQEIAKEHHTDMCNIVLAWMLQRSPEIIPLVAVSSVHQLKLNLKAQEIILSKEELEKLNK